MVKKMYVYGELADKLGISPTIALILKGETLKEALENLKKHEKFKKGVEELMSNYNAFKGKAYSILINGKNIESYKGLETQLNEDSEVIVFFNIAGG